MAAGPSGAPWRPSSGLRPSEGAVAQAHCGRDTPVPGAPYLALISRRVSGSSGTPIRASEALVIYLLVSKTRSRRSRTFRTVRYADVGPEPAVESLGNHTIHVEADPALHSGFHHPATARSRVRPRAFRVLSSARATTPAPARSGRSGRSGRPCYAATAPPRRRGPAARARHAATGSTVVAAAGAAHRRASGSTGATRRQARRSAGAAIAARPLPCRSRSVARGRRHHHRHQNDRALHDASGF